MLNCVLELYMIRNYNKFLLTAASGSKEPSQPNSEKVSSTSFFLWDFWKILYSLTLFPRINSVVLQHVIAF